MGRLRRYPSDLTDSQWAHLEPLLPPPSQDGRKPKHPRRDLVDAILYVGRAGCAWRALPVDFPPWQTVYGYVARWHDAEVTKAVHDALRGKLRVAEGRDAKPTAGVIDSQSVQGADTVGQDSRGYDAGKKINGRKRFGVTDTLGLLLTVMSARPAWPTARVGGAACLASTSTSSVWSAARGTSSPIAASPASSSTGHTPCCRSPSRWCASLPASAASPSSAAAGSWSGPTPGSPLTVGSPATTNATPLTPKR